MLNIGKLRKGGELYYLNSVARGVEDYYTGSGEAPGYWISSGADTLALAGEVDKETLRAVLAGNHPTTGERLVNGKLPKRERVPGFDLTFRAPKSVSLLHALGGKEASNEVVSAHDVAVAAALDFLDRHASFARRGKGGHTQIKSRGFLGAAFRHRTSRAGDPLLHTHVLVANLVKGEDGRWGALDGRLLYLYAKTAGYLYQAVLRTELTRRIGVKWSPTRRGCADIEGISRKVIRAFSRRRSEMEEIVGEVSEANAKAAQAAALISRQAKDYKVVPNDLLPEWRDRARSLGLSDRAMNDLLHRHKVEDLSVERWREIELELAGPDGLTKQSSSYTRKEVIQALCGVVESGATVEKIEELADAFLASGYAVALGGASGSPDSLRSSDGRVIPVGVDQRRYSTDDMLLTEQTLIERAVRQRHAGSGVARADAVESALARRPMLFADQEAMVRRLTTSGQGIEVVIGKAGTGKTFALDAARDAWEASGKRVIGCALAGRAVEELQLGAGIDSYTITSLLMELADPQSCGLAHDSVVVVDEAGMVGTRDLQLLLDHAERAGAKVVLVGDDRQLPAIQAGGAFAGIKERLPSIELTEVRRQPLGWERGALELMREGRSEEALETYAGHDRIVIGRDNPDTCKQLITDWWESYCNDEEPAVMIAAHRSDVDDLNGRARAVMKSSGRLGDEELLIAGAPFAVGDRVMTLKNNRWQNVKNGNRGTVTDINHKRREVTFRRDDGRIVTLPRWYIDEGFVTHAYAITGHKSQGMTTDKAYVLGDETLYREWTYVAMSRGRYDNRLYVVAGNDPERDELGGQIAEVEDPLDELTRAVARSRAKELATDSYERDVLDDVQVRELSLEL